MIFLTKYSWKHSISRFYLIRLKDEVRKLKIILIHIEGDVMKSIYNTTQEDLQPKKNEDAS